MYTIGILAVLALIALGLTIWKAPPIVRTCIALILFVVTIYGTANISRARERSRIHTTYFRGLSMAFWELDHLAKTNAFDELAIKLDVLKREFPDTTDDETAFNELMGKMLDPSAAWKDE